jgi:hypothetical protein
MAITSTPSPNLSRSRSPSLVASAMTAAQLNQPASRLLPNYVACTGQFDCLMLNNVPCLVVSCLSYN